MQTLESIEEGYRPDGLETIRQKLNRNNAKIAAAALPGDWQIPGLGGGWIGLGGGYQSPRYRINDEGMVTLSGSVQHTDSDAEVTIFTLLEGFRPAADLIFYVYSAGGACRVNVQADGDVVLTNPNHFGTSLDGIQFYVG